MSPLESDVIWKTIDRQKAWFKPCVNPRISSTYRNCPLFLYYLKPGASNLQRSLQRNFELAATLLFSSVDLELVLLSLFPLADASFCKQNDSLDG